MKVILKEDVPKLGEEGEVVDVADGYGRNYLIPQRKAVMATPGNIKSLREDQRQQARKIAKRREEGEELAQELQELDLELPAKVGEGNRIFGTITSQQLSTALADRGFDIDRRNITIQDDVRMLGTYSAKVQVHPDIETEMQFEVVPKDEEEEE